MTLNYNNIIDEIEGKAKPQGNGFYISVVDVVDIINQNTYPANEDLKDKDPWEKYKNNPIYQKTCDILENLIDEGKFNPDEIFTMWLFACLRYKWSRINPFR